jgi:AraC-like DNA-binding protein
MTGKRRLFIVGAVLAACAFAGGAYAATSDTSPRQAFLNDIAKRLNVSPQQLKSAIEGALQDQLNAAVKAGKLTQAQANAIEKRARKGLSPLPFLRPRLMRSFGRGPLMAAARYIGLRPAQLFEQLASGKSLAQIASAHGKTAAGLESAIVAAQRSRLDRARQRGWITSAQEQRLLSRLQAKIDELVNRAGIAPRLGPLMAPRPFFGPRMGPVFVPPGFPPARRASAAQLAASYAL